MFKLLDLILSHHDFLFNIAALHGFSTVLNNRDIDQILSKINIDQALVHRLFFEFFTLLCLSTYLPFRGLELSLLISTQVIAFIISRLGIYRLYPFRDFLVKPFYELNILALSFYLFFQYNFISFFTGLYFFSEFIVTHQKNYGQNLKSESTLSYIFFFIKQNFLIIFKLVSLTNFIICSSKVSFYKFILTMLPYATVLILDMPKFYGAIKLSVDRIKDLLINLSKNRGHNKFKKVLDTISQSGKTKDIGVQRFVKMSQLDSFYTAASRSGKTVLNISYLSSKRFVEKMYYKPHDNIDKLLETIYKLKPFLLKDDSSSDRVEVLIDNLIAVSMRETIDLSMRPKRICYDIFLLILKSLSLRINEMLRVLEGYPKLQEDLTRLQADMTLFRQAFIRELTSNHKASTYQVRVYYFLSISLVFFENFKLFPQDKMLESQSSVSSTRSRFKTYNHSTDKHQQLKYLLIIYKDTFYLNGDLPCPVYFDRELAYLYRALYSNIEYAFMSLIDERYLLPFFQQYKDLESEFYLDSLNTLSKQASTSVMSGTLKLLYRYQNFNINKYLQDWILKSITNHSVTEQHHFTSIIRKSCTRPVLVTPNIWSSMVELNEPFRERYSHWGFLALSSSDLAIIQSVDLMDINLLESLWNTLYFQAYPDQYEGHLLDKTVKYRLKALEIMRGVLHLPQSLINDIKDKFVRPIHEMSLDRYAAGHFFKSEEIYDNQRYSHYIETSTNQFSRVCALAIFYSLFKEGLIINKDFESTEYFYKQTRNEESSQSDGLPDKPCNLFSSLTQKCREKLLLFSRHSELSSGVISRITGLAYKRANRSFDH